LWQLVRGDLIREHGLGAIREDGVITLANGLVRLEPFLNPNLLAWTRAAAPDAALAIRLGPYFALDDAPLRLLFESILLPANPERHPGARKSNTNLFRAISMSPTARG
jgi:hypothetical protein